MELRISNSKPELIQCEYDLITQIVIYKKKLVVPKKKKSFH